METSIVRETAFRLVDLFNKEACEGGHGVRLRIREIPGSGPIVQGSLDFCTWSDWVFCSGFLGVLEYLGTQVRKAPFVSRLSRESLDIFESEVA